MANKGSGHNVGIFLLPDFWLHLLLAFVVAFPTAQLASAHTEKYQEPIDQNVDHFRLISTVEYTAERGNENRQYRHQAEPWFTVERTPENAEQTRYKVWTESLQFMGIYDDPEYNYLSEINYLLTDKRYMSEVDDDLIHLQKMNNEAIRSLNGRAVNDIGKTWTHRFDLGIFDHYSLPKELKFTIKSIKVPTKYLGDLIAVRAISDEFLIKAATQADGYGYVRCKTASVYLFDPNVPYGSGEEVYVSATVFVAATKMDDMTQQYRYEFGTYKTDANEAAVDLEGLDFNLEDFVREIKLIPYPIEVKEWAGLPYWAQSEIVNAAQIASACSAVVCEQSLVNPVASRYLAAARVYAYQDECALISCGRRSVCQALRQDVAAINPMNICGEDSKFLAGWLLWGAAIAIPLAICHDCDKPKSPCK
ncbi:MAG: hypothetical protein K8R02_02490 [Anaerohalosphaeraceae bacterium]|nr:hypothetical protein [Anaerohalosphaeraceae bacterium]